MELDKAKKIINQSREERLAEVVGTIQQIEEQRRKVNIELDEQILAVLGDEFVIVESKQIIAKTL